EPSGAEAEQADNTAAKRRATSGRGAIMAEGRLTSEAKATPLVRHGERRKHSTREAFSLAGETHRFPRAAAGCPSGAAAADGRIDPGGTSARTVGEWYVENRRRSGGSGRRPAGRATHSGGAAQTSSLQVRQL